MGILMTWGSNWVGQACSELPNVDEAMAALRRSCRRSLRNLTCAYRGNILGHACKSMGALMDTEGREAVSAGKHWSAKSGPLWVMLDPRNQKSPRPR